MTASPGFDDYFAKVVTAYDEYTCVINKGARDGVRAGQRFIIFNLQENDIIDPDTGENLGRLEIIKGTAVAAHVQEKLTTLESDQWEKDYGKVPFVPRSSLYGGSQPISINVQSDSAPLKKKPFRGLSVNDFVRPL